MKLETESIKSSLCDYSDTSYTLTVNAVNDTPVAFKKMYTIFYM